MSKTASPLVLGRFDQIIFIRAGNDNILIAWVSLRFDQVPPLTTELAALERQKNINFGIKGKTAPPRFLG